jgi:hypothetical protein
LTALEPPALADDSEPSPLQIQGMSVRSLT